MFKMSCSCVCVCVFFLAKQPPQLFKFTLNQLSPPFPFPFPARACVCVHSVAVCGVCLSYGGGCNVRVSVMYIFPAVRPVVNCVKVCQKTMCSRVSLSVCLSLCLSVLSLLPAVRPVVHYIEASLLSLLAVSVRCAPHTGQ